MSPLVVLVGPPGAGKTTVGRLLAQRRGVDFRDTDLDIENEQRRSVADIFVVDGEPRFRELEAEAVRRALGSHAGVMAVGGGAVVDASTRERLTGQRVIHLDVGLSAAADRIGLNRDRPLLLGNPRATLRAMLAERRPLYLEVAAATVLTDDLEPGDVAAAVEELL